MSGGQRSALSWVAIVLAAVVVFGVLQLGAWMMAGSNVPLIRLHLDEVDSVGIWRPWGRFPVDVSQSLGLVACDGPVHQLKKHLYMRWCSPRSWYGSCSPFSIAARVDHIVKLIQVNLFQKWKALENLLVLVNVKF
jgi:hypothetical protein